MNFSVRHKLQPPLYYLALARIFHVMIGDFPTVNDVPKVVRKSKATIVDAVAQTHLWL